jgi:quercetin dioxygenase-like cupin family protein
MTLEPTAVVASRADHTRESFDDRERGDASWFTLFSADRTPTSAMSAGLMEVPPGGVLKAHRHQQAEIYFVHEGTGVLTVNSVETRLVTGAAAFIPGDAEHSVRNDAKSVLRIFYVFPTDRFSDVTYHFPGLAASKSAT